MVEGCGSALTAWYVRDNETGSDSAESRNWEDYYKLKRTWRKSKASFEDVCAGMTFRNLFSTLEEAHMAGDL